MSYGTHRTALELALAADPALTDPVHSALVALTRSLADELDAQADKPQTRTQATYAGQLGAMRRVVADARELRRRESRAESRPASRLSLIKDQATKARGAE